MSEPQTEFDTPWKDVIERYFEDFIRFFFPQAHSQIAWARGFEFLDKELQQVVRDAELERTPLVMQAAMLYGSCSLVEGVSIKVESNPKCLSNLLLRSSPKSVKLPVLVCPEAC